MTVKIIALHALEEMYPAVELQKLYWGNDIESVVPAHMLFTIATTGGHVLAAMDAADGGRMIGVLIGLVAIDDAHPPQLSIASKRMVVLPDYRSRGIGYQLKLAQREVAMRQGIELVTWTFDPLLAKNAHLNMHKLGCIGPAYLQDYYGMDDSTGLATLGSSDRLQVAWWVAEQRVISIIEGQRSQLRHHLERGAAFINTTRQIDSVPHPIDGFNDPAGAVALLEVPLDYPGIVEDDPPLAMAWRQHTRALFQQLMAAGYIVMDFIRETHEGHDRGFYVLSYNTVFDANLD